FDLLSTRGIAAVVGMYKITPWLFAYGSFDLPGPGLDAGVRFVPLSWKISPFIGGGLHTSLAALGIVHHDHSAGLTIDNQRFDYVDIWGPGGHIDIGV